MINIFLQLSVQVRKNPGLGFSIAGGVAGAETVSIVYKSHKLMLTILY